MRKNQNGDLQFINTPNQKKNVKFLLSSRREQTQSMPSKIESKFKEKP
jgi:hypothetical protein